MYSLTSPEALLSVAKITVLLLITFVIAPVLNNPIHRARIWTATILILPLIVFTSFTSPLLKIITIDQTIASQSKMSEKLTMTKQNSTNSLSYQTSPSIESISITSEPPIQNNTIPTIPTIPLDDSPLTNSIDKASPFPWLFTIFISGALITLIPWTITTFKLLRLSKSTPIDPPLSLWKEIHQSSRSLPAIFFTPSPAAPFTCGIFKPRILLPDDSPEWPQRLLHSTLLHEASHLQRRDPLVRFLAILVRALFWFHPLIWIANKQLISAQEQACDQYAITHGISPDNYAEDLLTCATHSHLTPSEAVSMAKYSQLGNRIRYILEKPKPNNMKTIILTTCTTLITTLTLTSIGFSNERGHSENEINTISSISTKSRGALLDRKNKPLAIDKDGKRIYPFGKTSAHLTGYITPDKRKGTNSSSGKSGLEKSYNTELSNKKDIQLTLDATLQEHCYKILEAQKKTGVIVIQNPSTGEILAMVSYPSFDPNFFIPQITQEDYNPLLHDENKPFLHPRRSCHQFHRCPSVK